MCWNLADNLKIDNNASLYLKWFECNSALVDKILLHKYIFLLFLLSWLSVDLFVAYWLFRPCPVLPLLWISWENLSCFLLSTESHWFLNYCFAGLFWFGVQWIWTWLSEILILSSCNSLNTFLQLLQYDHWE